MTGVTGDPLLAQLRRHVRLHARAQGLAPEHCRRLLAGISRTDGEGPGSWPVVWSRAGDALAGRGRYLEAGRHYALARFPYAGPGDAVRHLAQERSVAAFDRWRRTQRGIGRLELRLAEGEFACWTAGLHPRGGPRPLVLVMGGIVSVKEQWAPILARADALGVAFAVTELPGVGENTLRYGADSHRMISAVLDALADRADVRRTSAVALSFGGHLALRAALGDDRIRGIATVGAPVHHFFLDRDWHPGVPAVTAHTLAHLIGCPPAEVFDAVRPWALTGDELARLRVPVTYAAALRDDIVPLTETGALLSDPRAPHRVLFLDDEHGAPAELARVRVMLLRAALRASGARPVRRAALAAADGAGRLRAAVGRAGRLAV
ncbi:alpha/beta hydrolase [Streptomyces sp. NPDC006208]|uniref:alpha/beta hydrolase n=1 Tax=Streptomyces sp. NPDC006208 TaxID=3156734 RepID=UPI0033AA1B7F